MAGMARGVHLRQLNAVFQIFSAQETSMLPLEIDTYTVTSQLQKFPQRDEAQSDFGHDRSDITHGMQNNALLDSIPSSAASGRPR